MNCPRCGGGTIHVEWNPLAFSRFQEQFDRCPSCGWQSNFATQRAEREEVTEWVYDEGDDDDE